MSLSRDATNPTLVPLPCSLQIRVCKPKQSRETSLQRNFLGWILSRPRRAEEGGSPRPLKLPSYSPVWERGRGRAIPWRELGGRDISHRLPLLPSYLFSRPPATPPRAKGRRSEHTWLRNSTSQGGRMQGGASPWRSVWPFHLLPLQVLGGAKQKLCTASPPSR